MGNKAGKFDVPPTTAVNKDEAVINETDVKVEEKNNGDAHEVKADGENVEENAPPAAPKKKNVMSWLKKVSIRKGKTPKSQKENGLKEEVIESPKENGDVEIANHVDEAAVTEEVITNGHKDHSEDDNDVTNGIEEAVEEKFVSNGHENGVESTESPVDEQ